MPGERQATGDDEMPRKRLEMSKFQEIPIRVELLVRFEVHSKTREQGKDWTMTRIPHS